MRRTAIDPRAALELEAILVRRLQKDWAKQSALALKEIDSAIRARDWTLAVQLAEALDFSGIGEAQRDLAYTIFRGIADHGARTAANGDALTSSLSFSSTIKQSVTQWLSAMQYTVTQEVQTQALQLIASAQRELVQKGEQPLYVQRKLTNAQEIIDWAKSVGFETTLPAESMHCTILYSKTPMDWGRAPRQPPYWRVLGGARRLSIFGHSEEEQPVVLEFYSTQFTDEHKALLEAGGSSDYPDYKAHVTLTYKKPPGLNLLEITPYQGHLDFGPQVFEQIITGGPELVEKHNPYHEPAGSEKGGRFAEGPKVSESRLAEIDTLAKSISSGSGDHPGHSFVSDLKKSGWSSKDLETLSDTLQEEYKSIKLEEGEGIDFPPDQKKWDRRGRLESKLQRLWLYSKSYTSFEAGFIEAWLEAGGTESIAQVRKAAEKLEANKGFKFFGSGHHEGADKEDYAEISPRLVANLKALKKKTEKFYEGRLDEEVTLMRGLGTRQNEYNVGAAESWTTDSTSAIVFGQTISKQLGSSEYTILETKVKRSALLFTFESVGANWPPEQREIMLGLQEHVVLGGGISKVTAQHGTASRLPKGYSVSSGDREQLRMFGGVNFPVDNLEEDPRPIPVKKSTDSLSIQKADPIRPQVSFKETGDRMLQMISSLHTSRLGSWGFIAEADVRGMTTYKLSAVLDGRTSDFCRIVNGKEFRIDDARGLIDQAVHVDDPHSMKSIQPWPSQSRASLIAFEQMSVEQLVENRLMVPPFHPGCRTIMVRTDSTLGERKSPMMPQVIESYVSTPQTFADLGFKLSPAQVGLWNDYVSLNPTEVLQHMTGMGVTEVLAGKTNAVLKITPSNLIKMMWSIDEFKGSFSFDPLVGVIKVLAAEGAEAQTAHYYQSLKTLAKSAGAKQIQVGIAAGGAISALRRGFVPGAYEWQMIRAELLDKVGNMSLSQTLQLTPDQRVKLMGILNSNLESSAQLLATGGFPDAFVSTLLESVEYTGYFWL